MTTPPDGGRKLRLAPYGRCMTCNVPLLQRNGYAQTGMCGPCCTGEADTCDEITDDEDPLTERAKGQG